MAAILIYDPVDATVAGRATSYDPSANTPLFDAVVDKLTNPDLSGVVGVPWQHWKVSVGVVSSMTAGEKALIPLPLLYTLLFGDEVSVQDVGGLPGLPVLDGSQLVNIKHIASLLAGDRIKGDTLAYAVEGGFQFPGTEFADVDSISVTVEITGGGATGTLHIYDLTNSATIATVAFTETSPTVKDMGVISNLSSGPAYWELQLKTTDNNEDAILRAGYVRFR